MNLEDKYKLLRLKEMAAKTPAEEKKTAEDVKQFEKEHPDIADDVYFRARTEY